MSDAKMWDLTAYLPEGAVVVKQLHEELAAVLGPALDGVMFFDEGEGVRGLRVFVTDEEFAQGYFEAVVEAVANHVPEQPAPKQTLEERVTELETQLAAALALLGG